MSLRSAFTPNHKGNTWWTEQLPWLLFGGTILLAWIVLPSKIVPSPLAILAAIPKLWVEEGFGQELWTSIVLNLQASVVMIVTSLLVAYGTTIPALRPIAVSFSMGRFNSFVGLPFLLTLLIGDAHWIKVSLLAIGMSVFSVPAIVDVIRTIPKEHMDDARSLRMSEWRVVWEVVILGKFHDVIDVLRTNLAMGWCLLPLVEGTFRSEGGIGVMLLVENKYLRLDYVYSIIFMVGLFGLAGDRLILYFKRELCPYAFISTEQK